MTLEQRWQKGFVGYFEKKKIGLCNHKPREKISDSRTMVLIYSIYIKWKLQIKNKVSAAVSKFKTEDTKATLVDIVLISLLFFDYNQQSNIGFYF